ncbi:bifunctional DNA-formamidopyrimidine glycosylase/DNA-(apurinic or apyrimidinic site) lyase [Henriciella litoralis]|uniref:bifunctional DNA-formamidopyrimidine glycosylase/DNA-(apurinic or apyrimidinic site) lyase n=1 Tax=Henriciella litoralis TaxID=568102 RepID=UPI0009FEC557|nr:bifunctional DNA-formamidopyrimidine glycosylase/DNA-(apurinic or apyrimidinic site) lyase [Henriciella litoralis]
MPELPEVETVRRGLSPIMDGKRILSVQLNRANLRFPFAEGFAERLTGARIERLGRRAKFLVAELETGEALIMHLGMSGRFTITGQGTPGEFHHEIAPNSKHDHVILNMEGGHIVTYNDPRRFGFMELWPLAEMETYPRLAGFGPEPLTNGFSHAWLNDALRDKSGPIKSVLLDQRTIAGLGNIYVCEALYRAGISPRRRASTVPGSRAARLAPAINDVIAEAIQAGGSSISDFKAASGELGYFQHSFAVYDREGEPCKKCGAPIKRIVQSGRSSFYCGNCQR